MASETWWQIWRHGWKHESVARALRSTLALASVMAGGWWLDQTPAVIPLLLGVIASALAETDDSWRGRLRVQLATLGCFAAMAFAAQAALPHPGWMAALLAGAAFGLTLLGALGERYRAVAFATLILSIYTALAAQSRPDAVAGQVGLLLAGAAWFGLISVLWAAALPMLPVRQNLAQLYEALGEYLHLKSRLFEPVRGIDLERHRLALALHNGRVVEALNTTKESLFSHLVPGGRRPAWLEEAMHPYFVAQDVHERASSSHEHYDVLADAFFHSDVLYRCQRVLALLGLDCLALARALRQRDGAARDAATARAMEDLRAAIAHVDANDRAAGGHERRPLRALHALAANLADMDRELAHAFQGAAPTLPADPSLLDRQPRTLAEAGRRVRAQLHLSSPLMRHAVRLAVALLAGCGLMRATGDPHGFWILLTIVFVCQPQYGATLTRLAQRIWGTVLGLVVGWALLRLFPGALAQSAFTVAAGVLFFATRKTRYPLATAAITTLVLLSFHQVGDGYGLIVPRLLDTLAGSLIAGLAVALVLPSWQSRQLHRVAAQALRAQAQYLRELMAQYQGGKQDHLAYRLARRNAHNADAALSGVLSAMRQEPGRVRRNAGAGMRFLVLSHTLLNYLSGLGAHRETPVPLADDDPEARAVAGLASTLDALANALDTGLPAPASAPESALLDTLADRAGEALPEARRVLRAQLTLALRLLPALREQAGRLGQGGDAAPAPQAPQVPPADSATAS